VVEVGESSLAFDREHKASAYARAGVEDYWIVNLVDGVLEVCREPVPDPAAVFGWRYRSVTRLAPPAAVTPIAFLAGQVSVTDLLPRRSG
jgi:Uma2 family endonuclease